MSQYQKKNNARNNYMSHPPGFLYTSDLSISIIISRLNSVVLYEDLWLMFEIHSKKITLS